MSERLTIHIHDRSIAVRAAGSAETPQRVDLFASSSRLDATALAGMIRAAVDQFDAKEVRAALVIPSSWCYVHRVAAPQRRPTHAMLKYALEEYLPCDIETLTCAFVRTGGGRYIGVALETARVAPLVEALAAADIRVTHMTLDVFDAAHGVDSPCAVWCDEEHVAVLRGAAANEGPELRVMRFAAMHTEHEWRGRVVALLAPILADSAGDTHLAGCIGADRLQQLRERFGIHAAISASDHRPARGGLAYGFDLARDGLQPAANQREQRASVRRSLAALLVASLLLAAGLLLQRGALQNRLESVAQWERQVFAQVLPGQPVPAGVALRIASERRRMENLTLAGGDAPLPQADALRTLRSVVAAVPSDLRLDLQEIRIEAGNVTLRGRTRDHAGAERLAAAIDALEALDCSAPRTDRGPSGGVQFFLNATRPPDDARIRPNGPNAIARQTAWTPARASSP